MIKPTRLRLALTYLAACLAVSGTVVLVQRLRLNEHQQVRIPPDVQIIRDVEYGRGGDVFLKLDIVRPRVRSKEPMPAVVFIHGGSWRKGNREDGYSRIIPLAQKGYFTATISYRLTDVAPFPAQIEDCKCAIRWMRAHAKEYNIDPDRIGVWGTSAGGHLAALLGTSGGVRELEGKGGWEGYSSKVQAVADYSGPADFLTWLDDVRNLGFAVEGPEAHPVTAAAIKLLGGPITARPGVAKAASPVTYVNKDDPPVFIAHIDEDHVVPLNQSLVFHDRLKAKGIEATLHIVHGEGHGLRDPETDKMVADFFDKHL